MCIRDRFFAACLPVSVNLRTRVGKSAQSELGKVRVLVDLRTLFLRMGKYAHADLGKCAVSVNMRTRNGKYAHLTWA